MISWVQLKQGLLAHYSAPQREIFKQFRLGATFFAVGLIIVILTNQTIPPSLKQELLVLAGLTVGASGFTIAMLAYIRLVISRFIRFCNTP